MSLFYLNIASLLFLSTWTSIEVQAAAAEIFVNAPACSFFQCHVAWFQGDTQAINWLNVDSGNVLIQLGSQTDLSAEPLTIAASVPAVSDSSECDSGSGIGVPVKGTTCGRFVFVVPTAFTPGEYSVSVTSLVNKKIQGFTDRLDVKVFNASSLGKPLHNPPPAQVQVVSGGTSSSSSVSSSTTTISKVAKPATTTTSSTPAFETGAVVVSSGTATPSQSSTTPQTSDSATSYGSRTATAGWSPLLTVLSLVGAAALV